jgi:phosphatidylserine/phosphatidylglycerophosphate/cardiolipin synthase-like enzyme
MAVGGEAASSIGDVARERWLVGTGETLQPEEPLGEMWPPELVPDFRNVDVAIARTVPHWGKTRAVHEVARLTEDMLSAAQQSVYIESQYLTASNVRRLITRSLAGKRGPEIVILVKRSSPGILERFVMGANRDRMMRHLRRADQHNRLRLYYGVVNGKDGECEVLLHSKVLIVDDRIMRIGSSNLNNRSMGLDTECDLAIEASTDAHRGTIVDIRNRLLAEHLDVSADVLSAAIARTGSLIRGIDACNTKSRGLRPFPEMDLEGPTDSISASGLMDPPRPLKVL